MFVAIIAILMIFGIPLSAILGSFYIKAKKLELEAGGGASAIARLARLEAENADLRKRVEVLETIVTSDTPASVARVRVSAQGDDASFAEVPASGQVQSQRRGA